MAMPLTSMEQLMPFATAGELVAKQKRPLVGVAPGTPVYDAVQRMSENHIGFLVVLENDALAGVLSERDCARRVILEQRSAKGTSVGEIMTTTVHSVHPDSKIPECIMLMHEHGIRHLVVTDGGKVRGVVSVRDVMGSLIERHERLLRRLHEERLTLLFPDPSSY